jgi:hypothetical protein
MTPRVLRWALGALLLVALVALLLRWLDVSDPLARALA